MSFNHKTILCACILAAVVICADNSYIFNFQTNNSMKLNPITSSTNLANSCAFTDTVTLTPLWQNVNNVTSFNTLTAAGSQNTTLAACHNWNVNYLLLNSTQFFIRSNSTIDLMSTYLLPINNYDPTLQGLLLFKDVQYSINHQGMETSTVFINLLILTPGIPNANPPVQDSYAIQSFAIDFSFSASSTSSSQFSALFE